MDPGADQGMPPQGPQQGGGQFLPDDFEIPVEGSMARNPVSGTPSGMDETQVSEDEQSQYDEFTTMALGIVHGLQKKGPNRASADIILDYFKIQGTTVPQALGIATAEVCYTVHNYFKHNKVEISADVVFAAAQEVMSEIYEVATAARVIPVGKLPQPGSPQEEQLLGKALMYATDQFARRLETSGQIPQKEAAEHLNSEMRREAETGELDDFDPKAEADADGLAYALKRVQSNMAPKDPVADMEAQGYPRMIDVNNTEGVQ